MAIYSHPIRCKLVVDNKPVEQIINKEHHGVFSTNRGKLKIEVREQVMSTFVLSLFPDIGPWLASAATLLPHPKKPYNP